MIATEPTTKEAPESSEHWYMRDGKPCYEQATLKGGLRATNLRDARKLGLVPSVTTVLGVLAKPALTNWMVDQGIMAALTLPRVDGESETDFLRRVKEDSKQQGKLAAEEGTRIHDACEHCVFGDGVPDRFMPYAKHISAVEDELTRLFPDVTDWIAEKSFGHESGFGGKVDLHSPSTGIVVDYKGKDGDFSDGKKLAYDQHWQLAAYQRGMLLPRNVCANIFVSRSHPGKVASHVWKAESVEDGWRVFQAALNVWKALRKFDPSFDAMQKAA